MPSSRLIVRRLIGVIVLTFLMISGYIGLRAAFAVDTTIPDVLVHRDFGDVVSQVNENFDYQVAMPDLQRTLLPPITYDQPLPANVPVSQFRRGGERLAYSQIGTDYRTFELFSRPVRWNIADGVQVTALTFNGMIPAPLVMLQQGQRARIAFSNGLDENTLIQWRGLEVTASTATATENITTSLQNPIAPSDSRYYEFTADTAGAYPYYAAANGTAQLSLGMVGMVIVSAPGAPGIDAPLIVHEWRVENGATYLVAPDGEGGNYFTLNGKAFPNTDPIQARANEPIRLHLFNASQHPFRYSIEGQSFTVISINGESTAPDARAPIEADTLNPGDHHSIVLTITDVGSYTLRSLDAQFISNNGSDVGGWMIPIEVSEGS